jgi:hypothetical protein
MKILMSVLALVVSLNLSAHPREGDFSQLDGTIQGMSVRMRAHYEAFRNGRMSSVSEVYANGQRVGREVSEVPENEIMTPELAQMIVAGCSQLGGTYEQLNLPVGNYMTCRIATESIEAMNLSIPGFSREQLNGGFVWLGAFPVNAIAKIQTPDGSLVITDFAW